MRRDCVALAGRAMIVAGVVVMASSGDCDWDKVPTFQELTQQEQAPPAVSGTPVDAAKQAPAQQPVAVSRARVFRI